MSVLIACEESQACVIAFRNVGVEAYSCDVLPCSGGHPEWHIQGDVLPLLKETWDMILAFPPCTYLAATGNRWFRPEYASRFPDRRGQREEAAKFFMAFIEAESPRICVENPVGVMSTRYRKPDQYIHPYMFGHEESKKTGLWLKGLPLLRPTKMSTPQMVVLSSGKRDPRWHYETASLPAIERSVARSKTYPGIARAMAEQWGGLDN